MVEIGPVVVGSPCRLHEVAPSIDLNPIGYVAGVLRSLIEDGEYLSTFRQKGRRVELDTLKEMEKALSRIS